MITTRATTATTLDRLAAWSALACDVLNASRNPADTEHIQAVKRRLLIVHQRQLAEVRALMASRAEAEPRTPSRAHAWAEVISAMKALDEYVALTACGLLERAVLAAYERAPGASWLNLKLARLMARHRQELLDTFPAPQRRHVPAEPTSRPLGTAPVLTPVLRETSTEPASTVTVS